MLLGYIVTRPWLAQEIGSPNRFSLRATCSWGLGTRLKFQWVPLLLDLVEDPGI